VRTTTITTDVTPADIDRAIRVTSARLEALPVCCRADVHAERGQLLRALLVARGVKPACWT
jgi:hypothetical protein